MAETGHVGLELTLTSGLSSDALTRDRLQRELAHRKRVASPRTCSAAGQTSSRAGRLPRCRRRGRGRRANRPSASAFLAQRRERLDANVAARGAGERLRRLRDVAQRAAPAIVLLDDLAVAGIDRRCPRIRSSAPVRSRGRGGGRSSSRRTGRRPGASSPTSRRGRRAARVCATGRPRTAQHWSCRAWVHTSRTGRSEASPAVPSRGRSRSSAGIVDGCPISSIRVRDARPPSPTATAAERGAHPRGGRIAGSRRAGCRRPPRDARAPARSPDRGVIGRRRACPMRRRSRRAASERRIRRCPRAGSPRSSERSLHGSHASGGPKVAGSAVALMVDRSSGHQNPLAQQPPRDHQRRLRSRSRQCTGRVVLLAQGVHRGRGLRGKRDRLAWRARCAPCVRHPRCAREVRRAIRVSWSRRRGSPSGRPSRGVAPAPGGRHPGTRAAGPAAIAPSSAAALQKTAGRGDRRRQIGVEG